MPRRHGRRIYPVLTLFGDDESDVNNQPTAAMESHSAPQSAPSPTGSTVGGSARTVVARSALDDLLVLLRAGGDADAQRACIGAGIGGDGDNPPAVPPGDLARKAAELASRLR